MRATYMEEGILENAALILDEPELEAMVIGSVNTNATISEIEVWSEAIDMEDDDDVGVWLSCWLSFILF